MNAIENYIVRAVLFENLLVGIVIDALLPLILPLIEPDKYKQTQWQYHLMGCWILFHGSIQLPKEIRQKLLFSGYFQILVMLMSLVYKIL